MPACCWTFTRDGTIVDWNRACTEVYGWTAEEAVGKRMYDLLVQERSAQRTEELVAALFAGRRFEGLEFEDLRADGTKVMVLANEFPLRDADGVVVLGACVQMDLSARRLVEEAREQAWRDLEALVTRRTGELSAVNARLAREVAERQRAEHLHEEQRLFLQAVLDAAPDAIVTLGADRRITAWNEAAERMFGYTQKEAMGGDLDRLITRGDTYQEAVHFTESALALKPISHAETVRYHKDGSPVEVLLSAAPINQDHVCVGAVAVYTDISGLKRAEEKLARYANELERANEEIKQFAYIVSHDLRAPLVNLKGFSGELRLALGEIESVLDEAQAHLDDSQRQRLQYALEEDVPEALGFIESSVSRMDAFIDAVLRLSRLGRRVLEPEPIDMEILARRALSGLAHEIGAHDAKAVIGQLPPVVADRTSMEQVVGNLLNNAVKYLATDRPGEIEVWGEREGNVTTFHVRDNGRGIAEADMDRVFAPFRRVGRQDQPGEGMGLPYVQTLVRRHGGSIWCESELNVGTTFSFTIVDQSRVGGDSDD
jgi:PAS domain S-box-containing protein